MINQMLVCIINNTTIHFASRCNMGEEKMDSARVVNDVFKGRWDLVPESMRAPLRAIRWTVIIYIST